MMQEDIIIEGEFVELSDFEHIRGKIFPRRAKIKSPKIALECIDCGVMMDEDPDEKNKDRRAYSCSNCDNTVYVWFNDADNKIFVG